MQDPAAVSSPTLAEFLLARLAEDERGAIAAMQADPAPWLIDVRKPWPGDPWRTRINSSSRGALAQADGAFVNYQQPTAEHIARHDPARVLAEVAAHRRIVELHSDDDGSCSCCGSAGEYDVPWPCKTVELLALPHAAHEDYRSEWAP